MTSRVARATFAFGGLLIATGCSDVEEISPVAAAPVEATLAGMTVRLEPSPLRIVVTASDGRVLFDGLPPRAVGAPTAELDPPPLTGLAVRDVTTTVEASYGSFQLTDAGSAWRVATAARSVEVSAEDISFEAVGSSGRIAIVWVRAAGPGELAIIVAATTTLPAGARSWVSLGARCAEDERFLGFGAQARDVEHRGTVVPLFVSEPGIGKRDDDLPVPIYYVSGTRHASSFPAPIYLSKRGYVGALDGPGRAVFGVCAEEDVLRISQDASAGLESTFDFRIFDGPTAHDALDRATARFGRPRMPPRLAFAPWNDAIFGTESVRAFAQLLRDEDVPSSAIWSEDFRGGAFDGDDYRLEEEWDVDESLYPGFADLVSDLRGDGLAMLTYFNTFVEVDNSVWDEAEPRGFLVHDESGAPYTFQGVKQKPTGLVDLTNPDARAWMQGKLEANLALGAAGWMGDFAEWLPLDASLADASDPWATHTLYPLLWQEVQRAALDSGGESERLAFVRSGWLGTAPLADVVWAGDQSTDFAEDDGLPTIVPMGLGLGIAGISTYASDVAGYQVALTKPSTKELFFRWTELGAWSPVMRTHHGTQPLKNWSLDRDPETTAHWRRYAILHQQLLPVWESLAKHASDTGVPIWRHLALSHSGDDDAWLTGDEFMVGDSILVAPVVEEGATSRPVYLPKGAWVPWEPGARLEGGTHDVDAPLGEIPVFVRAGSILSMLPDTVRTVLSDATGLVRVEDVGDDRVVLVALGGDDASFVETNGLRYSLTHAVGVDLDAFASATWNGAALAACSPMPVAPCVEVTAFAARAHVAGVGTLAAGGAEVVVEGGGATRSLVVDVR